MPSSVDLSNAVGFLQNGPNYGAIDVRRALSVFGREGVVRAGDLKVTQRAGGAAMAVDVAVGEALVQGDFVAQQALTVPTAHATLPRVDRVWLEIKDTLYDGSGLNKGTVRYSAGTATAGANATNLTGAPAIPGSALLLANIEVPAADTTITNSQIFNQQTTVTSQLGASFSAYRNAAITIPQGVATKVPYDTEEWDTHSWFDTTLGRFTPQVAAKYRFSAFQRMIGNTPSGYLFLYLYKNGSLHKVFTGTYPAGGVTAGGGSVLAQANGTTDYFEVFCEHNESGSPSLTTGIAFSNFAAESIG